MAPKRHASFTRASFTPPFTLLLSAFQSTSRILVFYSSISLATQFPAPSPIGSHPHQTFPDLHLIRFAHSSTCLGKYGLSRERGQTWHTNLDQRCLRRWLYCSLSLSLYLFLFLFLFLPGSSPFCELGPEEGMDASRGLTAPVCDRSDML